MKMMAESRNQSRQCLLTSNEATYTLSERSMIPTTRPVGMMAAPELLLVDSVSGTSRLPSFGGRALFLERHSERGRSWTATRSPWIARFLHQVYKGVSY